jgi:hypothetical protein
MVASMAPDAITFRASLDGFPGVDRDVAVRSDQTLVALHRVLQQAFGWDDDHLYSFWLDGEFWGSPESEYTSTRAIEPGQRSARVKLVRLGLLPGATIAYIFDFGDSWQVLLTVLAAAPADEEAYPRIVASRGDAPPQYEEEDDEPAPE